MHRTLVACLFALTSLCAAAAHAQDGRLIVITNFDNTEVQIDGTSYPYEWVFGDSTGIPVTTGTMHSVVVSVSPEQRRSYRLRLERGETRVLVVDIENMGSSPAAPPPERAPGASSGAPADDEEEGEVGYLGVSSSPRGIVHVDGASTGERTPARRIALEPGRHEVTIFYDEEEVMSEVKHVLIRSGVNTNVFFRMRREQVEGEASPNAAPAGAGPGPGPAAPPTLQRIE